ncbi:NAD(P)-dependent methylenetetrahydromethanopterin dehydrogenase [Aeoliella mucimassa]|uniref:Bifunctional protein MdtA n=1 Tax=Aeoliella mucimassa TaxID=2527972 RepID=A0A518AUC5_9BACT|nr:NAD(P)-dependent methylenetetrahydromethanopterin dehydrogenase [Aeoliella mucimassa]QDU58316.1 Bifunctional protein MdtA [Aeoliella mucimassa]
MPAKILICLDTDPQPSVFDSVVAVDSGADHLFRHAGVTPDVVRDLVYGAIFTRSPGELHDTAIFVGGSDVALGEQVLAEVVNTCFGPMRVSAMLDSSGSNTTAAAAVLAAGRHVELAQSTATVLAATGPVGQRVVRMLAEDGARVRLCSRRLASAEATAESIRQQLPAAKIECFATADEAGLRQSLTGSNLVFGCGAAGVELLPAAVRSDFADLQVAIDLNAVPPVGIEGIEVGDKAIEQAGTLCYGAIGIGGTKMKIHRAAIARLFTANDLVLDAPQIYALGKEIEAGK